MQDDVLALASRLSTQGESFAFAIVVRCERPTSAKPGAKALVRADGTVTGWIGGSCAEPVVVREALRALEDGEPRFIALAGTGAAGAAPRDGMRVFPMTCHSGGTIEVYIEPVLPKSQLILVGTGPVVETLAQLGEATGFTVTRVAEPAADLFARLSITPRTCIVVATHGTFDEEALDQALPSAAGYVSLVASRKRADAVVQALRAQGVPAHQLGRLRAPAGLDIGAGNPQEIAVSILAEVIQVSRSRQAETMVPGGLEPTRDARESVDPVCGMLVEIASAAHRSEFAGQSFYFCCARCKQAFDLNPAHFAASVAG